MHGILMGAQISDGGSRDEIQRGGFSVMGAFQ